MPRTLASIVLLLLLAPEASAQVAAGQAAAAVPPQAAVEVQAAFDTSRLLAVYMTQLAAVGAPPSQADIDEATRLYMTNGAAAAAVPTSGPGAAYFHEGAAAAGVPASGPGAAYFQNGAEVMAYRDLPVATPAPSADDVANPVPAGRGEPVDDGLAPVAPSPEGVAIPAATPTTPEPTTPAPASETPPPAPPGPPLSPAVETSELTCPPLQIQAAMAFASQFATASAPVSTEASVRPAVTSSGPLRSEEPSPAHAAESAPWCAAGGGLSLSSTVAPALGGAVFGGLAVVFWSRFRPSARSSPSA